MVSTVGIVGFIVMLLYNFFKMWLLQRTIWSYHDHGRVTVFWDPESVIWYIVKTWCRLPERFASVWPELIIACDVRGAWRLQKIPFICSFWCGCILFPLYRRFLQSELALHDAVKWRYMLSSDILSSEWDTGFQSRELHSIYRWSPALIANIVNTAELFPSINCV